MTLNGSVIEIVKIMYIAEWKYNDQSNNLIFF